MCRTSGLYVLFVLDISFWPFCYGPTVPAITSGTEYHGHDGPPALPCLSLGLWLDLITRLVARAVLNDPVPELLADELIDDGRSVLAGHRGMDPKTSRRLQGDIRRNLHLPLGVLSLWRFVSSALTRLCLRSIGLCRIHEPSLRKIERHSTGSQSRVGQTYVEPYCHRLRTVVALSPCPQIDMGPRPSIALTLWINRDTLPKSIRPSTSCS